MLNSLFVYGTLMNDEVLIRLLNRTLVKISATLSGYQCLAVSGELYPAIRLQQAGAVTGELLLGVSVQELELLDHYEGEYYQRIAVPVLTVDNKRINTQTYAFKPEYYQRLATEPWSNQLFRQQHLVTYLNAL